MLLSPPRQPVHPNPPARDARLRYLLETAGGVPLVSPPAARTSVRRRVAVLRRRRRVRRALGSGTLAAGIVAGSLHARIDGHGGSAAPRPASSSAPQGGPPPGRPARPPAAVPPGSSWSRDPREGVDREAADPGALYADGRVHVYTTSAIHCVRGTCRDYRVPRFSSADLALPGQLDADAMPTRPDWVAASDDAIWAPAAARIGGRYVLYFAATSRESGDAAVKCLGAAVSVVPEGPFVPLPDPLRCTPGYWSIDPYPVTDGHRWYLLWRQDDGANVTGRIVVAPLGPGGLTLDDPPTTLLVGAFPWEEGYPQGTPGIGPIENPAMVRHPATDEWLLAWSANRWETQNYATGLAVCAGPLGPCRRVGGAAPWLRTSSDPGIATSARLGGAGGLSFVVGPGKRLYSLLHAYRDGGHAPGAPRVAWAFRVEPSGTPAGYRLVEIGRNHSAEASVNES
jgi:Glycosyl hydrolases family 43